MSVMNQAIQNGVGQSRITDVSKRKKGDLPKRQTALMLVGLMDLCVR